MVTRQFLDINKLVSGVMMLLMPVLFFCLLFTFANSHSQPLKGSAIKCDNEGENVSVSLLSDDPCITCKCKNKEVVCQREVCPNFKSCYLLFYGKNRTCCDICKGCWFNNRIYKSGDSFVDDQDPCRKFLCNSGVITEYKTYCHVPCKNPISIENQCCPSCGRCEVNNKVYSEGELIPNNLKDPCITCRCIHGNMICSKESCPVLACPQSKWIFPKDECCPLCKGHKKIKDFDGSCFIGLSTYKDGETYSYDQCTDCVCNSTTNICKRKICPPLECPSAFQITEPGECCSKCQEAQEQKSICAVGGHEYKNGEHWQMDNCHKCSCLNGQIRCQVITCPKSLVCPDNHKLLRLKGECCNSCVEEHATCKLSNNLTEFKTFDGKTYSFKGPCNYILSKDCSEKSFSIHLVNRNYKNSTLNLTRNSTLLISSIMMRIEDTKVRFGLFHRVRVGRKRVRLPHLKLGVLSIVQDGQRIVLRANIGVKIVWDYGKSLEIEVAPQYKRKTCGLCGNYNGNIEDEFMTKRKRTVEELEKFAYSWKVGKTVVCDNPKEKLKTSKSLSCINNLERRVKAMKVCEILKSQLFSSCHSFVRINSYFGKCMKDVCSCNDSNSENCHCNSILGYVNECRKFGLFNRGWKRSSLCDARKCQNGAVYKSCSSPCKLTCRNYKRLKYCRKICQPGCDCPSGKVWHNGVCVDPQECPSYR